MPATGLSLSVTATGNNTSQGTGTDAPDDPTVPTSPTSPTSPDGSGGDVSGGNGGYPESNKAFSCSNIDEIKNALKDDNYTSIEYQITDGGKVPASEQKEIFSAIKGENKEFHFTFQDEQEKILYKWTIGGNDIVDEDQTLSFHIDVDAKNPVILGLVNTDAEKLNLQFEHDGDLPGQMTVSVYAGGAFSTSRLYLYYYNQSTKQLELKADNAHLTSEGYAVFDINHCSDYVLTSVMLRSLIPNNQNNAQTVATSLATPAADEAKAPKTGQDDGEDESRMLYPAIIICVLSGAGVLWQKYRRMKR
jgi:hypothetical protein